MYLLYVDESGSVGNTNQRFFVLAGVAMFEREPHWIEQDLNEIAARFNPNEPHTVEFHESPMRAGKGFWRGIQKSAREQALKDALIIGVRQRFPANVRLFASVLEKSKYSGKDIAQIAFEQLCSRFDQFLGRLHKRHNNTQRGLIIFDKCATEREIQALAREFKTSGHSFGVTRNLAEVPVFVDSEASRTIQLADLVAYALLRNFEHGDPTLFELIEHCFDADGGVTHGLYCR